MSPACSLLPSSTSESVWRNLGACLMASSTNKFPTSHSHQLQATPKHGIGCRKASPGALHGWVCCKVAGSQTVAAATSCGGGLGEALKLTWKLEDPSRRNLKRISQERKGIYALGKSDGESTNRVVKGDVIAEEEHLTETGKANSSGSFLTFLCPLLKLLGGGDPAAPRNAFLETATTGVASLARLPWGSQVLPDTAAERTERGQPPQLFQLYEFEACPFCRRVREALTELDLSAEVYPCPKGSVRHREFVRTTGGKDQFPFFLDPNTGVSLYESSYIVKYLFKEYGAGRQLSPGLLESTLVTGWVPTLVRAGRGMMLFQRATAKPPEKMLELFSYENNQFARLVREALCELELPYILRNAGKGSSLQPTLLQLAGSTQVPYLVDPNTGVHMAESKDIISYLFRTYGSSSLKSITA